MPIEITTIIYTMGSLVLGTLLYLIYVFHFKPESVVDFTWTKQDNDDSIDRFIQNMRKDPSGSTIRLKVPKDIKPPPETTVSGAKSIGTLNNIIDIESIHLEDV